MQDEALTGKIIEGCFEVISELGVGFLEGVYEKALAIALSLQGLQIEQQVRVEVFFKGEPVGFYFADLVVEDRVIVELKCDEKLHPRHQARLINYLKASKMQLGLLVNFGSARLEIKRCYKPF